MRRRPSFSRTQLNGAVTVAAATAAGLVLATAPGAAQAAPVGSAPAGHAATVPARAAGTRLAARTVLSGKRLGLSKPDDLTAMGGQLFVAFQNGVPSTGGVKGTPSRSTVVEFTRTGKVLRRWQLVGKCDGLTADPTNQRLIATVNEDGRSSLYSIPVAGHRRPTRYRYDANPLPHGGGTDSITFDHHRMYLAASAPSTGTFGPAVYQVTLVHTTAKLTAVPFFDSSIASIANVGARNRTVHLALTDPDSTTVVPTQSPRFAGDFMLDAQGDQQQVYVSRIGVRGQHLQVLKLTQPVDDTAWVTTGGGTLFAANNTTDTIVAITGPFRSGTDYSSATPNTGKHYLATTNLRTGAVARVATTGAAVAPSGLLYLP